MGEGRMHVPVGNLENKSKIMIDICLILFLGNFIQISSGASCERITW